MTVVALRGPALDSEPSLAHVAPRPWVPKLAAIGADILTVALAMVAAFELRNLLPGNDPIGAQSQHVVIGALSLPVWVLVFSHYRLYNARFVSSRVEEARRILHAVTMSVLAIAVAGFMLRIYVARGWLLLTAVFGFVLLEGERFLSRRVFSALRCRGRFLRSVVIVGGNVEGLALCSMLMNDASLGYDVVGFVDDEVRPGTTLYGNREVLGTVADTLTAARQAGATGVIVATTSVSLATSNHLARQLTDAGVHVELSSTLHDIASERLSVHPLGRFPMLYIEPVQRRGWRSQAKRGLDIALSAALLIATLPALVIAAIAIKVDSRGPVVFRQRRVGKDGTRFAVLKLRTMVHDAEERLAALRERNEADGPLFKIHDDPRVTRVGRLLRTYSIDELPQLWNVLRGEMSLVGPRPALVDEVAAWTPELHNRLRVKPGLTGFWQVNGRSEATFEDYTRLDLYYVDNWSLWTDLAIVAKTVPAVLRHRGAC